MMDATSVRKWLAGYGEAWDRFWFTPSLPYTVCLLRIIAGVMLLYSHLVLATDLTSFLGASAWINNETALQLHDGTFGFRDGSWSYLWFIESSTLLWIHHGLAMLVTACFAVGLLTRITGPLTWFLQLMYLHRLTGALFGFDQIVTYTVMYLMLAPTGSCWSVDAWLRDRWADRRSQSRWLQWLFPALQPSVGANLATRLLQIHLCVIYLFGGLAKARGQTWWDGTAMWLSVGNYEYQSIDMTWLARFPRVFTAMTHVTLFWEIFYCALIWPRRTRPWMLAGAVVLHGGIACFLGMITFGSMMIAANLIFVPPEWIARVLGRRTLPAEDSSHEPAMSPGELAELDDATAERWKTLEEREKRVRGANKRLKSKAAKLKTRESKYRERVKRLREREAKIKRLIERRREAKQRQQDEKLPPR